MNNTTSTEEHSITPPLPEAEANPGSRTGTRVVYRVLVAVGIASGLLWLGAIVLSAFGYNEKPNDYLKDRTFPQAAEPICEAAMADLEKLPPADTSSGPKDRADVIEASTARLQTMLDTLRTKVPATKDAEFITMWINDWEVHLEDRSDFVKRLRGPKGAAEEFLETPKYGGQISKTVSQFAEVNAMESCMVPNDV